MLTRYFRVPAVFGESLFDDWMGKAFSDFADLDRVLYGKHDGNMMKMDVKEAEDVYQVAIEMPGFEKNEISAALEKGYLTVSAAKSAQRDDQDGDGRYLRRERYSGTMQRSFYVGEGVRQEDIRARYENGVLMLEVPKQDTQKLPENKLIAIEG